MDNKTFPITPPPELVTQWANHSASVYRENGTYEQHELAIATQAARWGADQELEACVEWLQDPDLNVDTGKLRADRRPKPLSLKEQALETVQRLSKNKFPCFSQDDADWELIRRALEALDG